MGPAYVVAQTSNRWCGATQTAQIPPALLSLKQKKCRRGRNRAPPQSPARIHYNSSRNYEYIVLKERPFSSKEYSRQLLGASRRQSNAEDGPDGEPPPSSERRLNSR
ncbi:hypothetical protein AVEN_42365-1 [Araneus ventricosus]|uniref:Uncharacterized protein n=1 Tax=Araneus ventricosus TaxID=182803 RepID=A0A4Y2VB54_ARAVE|nr:hypothetical protein AVEN_42365-1 [Araneus ventricosus]